MKIIQVKVKPNARDAGLEELGDGTWLAKIKAPPVDGKANAALIALVAEHFSIRRASVTIKRGASGRLKWVQLDGI